MESIFETGQRIMNALLYLPSLLVPGWADGVVGILEFWMELLPAPLNWGLVWFVRAILGFAG